VTFVSKTFANGDVLPAADLTDMDNNDDHVREEANYQVITMAPAFVDATVFPAGLYIDTTRVSLAHSTTGQKTEADISISGFANGLHVLQWKRLSTGILAPIRFCKTPDMLYLTYWINIVWHEDLGEHEFSESTVIFHRQVKGWS